MRKITTATAILLASTALVWAADVGKPELPKMHKTFEANPARFAHDYVGKSFSSSATVTDIAQRAPGSFSVTLDSSIVCPDVTIEAAQSFNKGDTVNLTGMVAAYSPQAMELGQCTFSRSVPVEEETLAPTPVPESRLAPAPAPAPVAMAEPKVIYLPQPPAPQVIYVQPASQGAQQAQPAAPEGSDGQLPPQSPVRPPQPSPLTRRDSYPVPADTQLPRVMTMACVPADGSRPFNVSLLADRDNSVLRIVGGPRYYVMNWSDNAANHILYIAAKRHNDVMYFAFDHSRFKDESATLVKLPGHDVRTKCSVNWQAVDNH